jgi:DNA mismatch repair protein MLH3
VLRFESLEPELTHEYLTMEQASLEKLDASTRVKLRSSQILTSLPQIVSELVQNSLDAGASAVDIGIDCEEWICWVKDNGCGISKDGLSVLGKCSEEGRYGA